MLADDMVVLHINGKRFVAGLFWQTLTSRKYMKEARKIGQAKGWDIVAIRKASRMQAGFVSKVGRSLKGGYSIAAALAGVLGRSWFGAFRVPAADAGEGRYVVVAVRDGAIIPGYDRICNQETATAALREVFNLYTDEVPIYAPSELGFGGKAVSLEEILTAKVLRRDYRLRELGVPWGTVAVWLALFAAVVIGGSEFQRYREDQARQEALRMAVLRKAELDRLNKAAKEKQDASALTHPWAKEAAPADLVQTCLNDIHALPLSLGGWLVESAQCSQDKITVRYRRDGGAPLLDFKVIQQARMGDWNLSILEHGERAELSKPITVVLVGDEQLVDEDPIKDAVISRAQLLRVQLDLNSAQEFMPAEPGVQPPPPPRPVPWAHTTFKYKGEVSPSQFFDGLPTFNGLRLHDVALQVNTGGSLEWSVSGDIYAKR